jgi:hypothetical protein
MLGLVYGLKAFFPIVICPWKVGPMEIGLDGLVGIVI